jgi:diguanylate cyclase (GGDEF)-like protein/putative nucleotidyltransferase with HDIG domain
MLTTKLLRGLILGTFALLMVCFYAAGLYLEVILAPSLPLTTTLVSFTCLLLLIYICVRRFEPVIVSKIDRLLCPGAFASRKALKGFSQKIANSIDLEEVANETLVFTNKVLCVNKVSLLLRSDEYFVPQFSYPRTEPELETAFRLRCESLIVEWLAKEGKPLKITEIPDMPDFRSMTAEEYADLSSSGLTLFLPIGGHENLIGIIAAGESSIDTVPIEDLAIVGEATRQAGIVIENAQLYSQAKNKANVDELTGLFNHRHFHERLFEEVSRSSRYGDIFSLLMIDLDSFKSYNDIHGHLHGDRILKKAGEVIRNNIRTIDVPARYGGDEFSAILPKSSIDSALRIANRLRNAMETEFNSEGATITCSIGVAVWPTDGLMKEKLIHAADLALYQAKKMGRNKVCTASKLATLKVTDKSFDQESNNLVLDTIYALAATVDAKDHYTYGHSNKVSRYACEIATELGYSEERMQVIKIAGLLHDIGKISVSDDILGKKDALDDSDWQPIHSHPEMGVSILRHVDSIKECLPGVLCHHERYDGTGYPQGLKGENIPLDARILAVADSYDAMTSARLYHDSQHTPGWAIEELIRCCGTQFDPKIVNLFIKILAKTSRKNQRFEFTHTNP